MRVALTVALMPVLARAGDNDLVARWDSPKRVTLPSSAGSVRSLLQEVARQTGHKVVLASKPRRPIRVQVADATFFEAVDAIAKAAGLRVKRAEGGLSLVDGGGIRPTTAYSGPARVAVHSVRAHAPKGDEDERIHELAVGFSCMLEPGFEEAELIGGVLERVVDDKGKNLASAAEIKGADLVRPFTLELYRPREGATVIKELAGRFRVRIGGGRTASVEFKRQDKESSKRLGGGKIILHYVEGSKVRVTVAGPVLRGVKMPMRITQIDRKDKKRRHDRIAMYAYDSKGQLLSPFRVQGWGDEPGMTYTILLRGKPARLVFEASIGAAIREFAFRFVDLKLP